MSRFASCELGHPRPRGSSTDTAQCAVCVERRRKVRLAQGYPPTGPLPPDPAQIGDAAPDLPDLQRRAA